MKNKAEHTDKEILEHYMLGWNDCADDKPVKFFKDELLQNAYNHGHLDFMVGDDVSSVDYQKEEEILKRIKN
jgi:hypothetical protein